MMDAKLSEALREMRRDMFVLLGNLSTLQGAMENLAVIITQLDSKIDDKLNGD